MKIGLGVRMKLTIIDTHPEIPTIKKFRAVSTTFRGALKDLLFNLQKYNLPYEGFFNENAKLYEIYFWAKVSRG